MHGDGVCGFELIQKVSPRLIRGLRKWVRQMISGFMDEEEASGDASASPWELGSTTLNFLRYHLRRAPDISLLSAVGYSTYFRR